MVEWLYRVDVYRRFLPDRGTSGLGLFQFYGRRASRNWIPGEEPPPWKIGADGVLHTVEVRRDLVIE